MGDSPGLPFCLVPLLMWKLCFKCQPKMKSCMQWYSDVEPCQAYGAMLKVFQVRESCSFAFGQRVLDAEFLSGTQQASQDLPETIPLPGGLAAGRALCEKCISLIQFLLLYISCDFCIRQNFCFESLDWRILKDYPFPASCYEQDCQPPGQAAMGPIPTWP